MAVQLLSSPVLMKNMSQESDSWVLPTPKLISSMLFLLPISNDTSLKDCLKCISENNPWKNTLMVLMLVLMLSWWSFPNMHKDCSLQASHKLRMMAHASIQWVRGQPGVFEALSQKHKQKLLKVSYYNECPTSVSFCCWLLYYLCCPRQLHVYLVEGSLYLKAD